MLMLSRLLARGQRTIDEEKHTMKRFCLPALLFLVSAAFAQEVRVDYDRATDFGGYRTYRWSDFKIGRDVSQLMDQHIKRAVDEQLAVKGLRRVDSGGDLVIDYRTAVQQEKQFDGFGIGPRWNGSVRVNSSTIEIGKIVIDMFDPARSQLVWRGEASKTLDVKKDADKNYRNLQKAMAKLFKSYPPATKSGSGSSS
jgi:hypothetical protein